MFQAMKRIAGCLARNNVNEGAIERAIRQSFLGIIIWQYLNWLNSYQFLVFLFCNQLCWNLSPVVSADMAHGVHPNFMEKHEEHHRPEMQKGLVIKHNANQRYATSGVTAFLFKEVGKIHNLPSQVIAYWNEAIQPFVYSIKQFHVMVNIWACWTLEKLIFNCQQGEAIFSLVLFVGTARDSMIFKCLSTGELNWMSGRGKASNCQFWLTPKVIISILWIEISLS